MNSDRTRDIQLALILGAARSGTTLLRSMLDAHPEIGCPAEAFLPGLIGHARRVWETVCSGEASAAPPDPLPVRAADDPPRPPLTPLPAHAAEEVRRAAAAVIEYYCRDPRKRVYCDKSLDNVHYLPAVHDAFPSARYLVMVRHVMDTVASGLEASPWGFNAFGYLPFVQESPDNTVMALARYWEFQMAAAARWEADHRDQCHRIRYEDLVTDPRATMRGVFEFLGVEDDPSVLVRAFQEFRPSGPGDYKLAFTTSVTAGSIGHGKQVPVALIPPPLLARLNGLLLEFGYGALSGAWNAEPGPVSQPSRALRRELDDLMRDMQGGPWEFDADSFAIVADDDADLRWLVDPRAAAVRQGDGEADFVITGATLDLIALIRGEANIGALLRSGRIRHVAADARDGASADFPRMMVTLAERLRAGRQASNGVPLDTGA